MGTHPGNLGGKPPLGLKEPPPPKKPRKAVPRESKKRKGYKASPEGKAGREHMAKVAAMRCVCCGYWPVEVHHCISDRYGQRKASDFETVPLCWQHHLGPDGIHTDKTRWEGEYGKDYDYLPAVMDQIAGEFNSPWR